MKCKICNNIQENKFYEAKEMMFGLREKFAYFQCSKCKCLQIEEIPLNISKYYPANYYSYDSPTSIKSTKPFKYYRNKLRDRYSLLKKGVIGKLLYSLFPKDSHPMLMQLYPDENSSILDVGCGNGSLLYRLSEIGFTHLLGVDPFIKEDIVYDNGLKILKKSIHEVKGSWNIIMFHHSFEHISDPAETLQSVAKLLTAGGICIIRVPTVSSFAWEKYQENWVQLDAPRHFFLHSVESILQLATAADLVLEEVIYDSSDFQFWGSEQYIHDIPLNDPKSYLISRRTSIFSKKEIKAFRKHAKELNQTSNGDSCAFFLKKLR